MEEIWVLFKLKKKIKKKLSRCKQCTNTFYTDCMFASEYMYFFIWQSIVLYYT